MKDSGLRDKISDAHKVLDLVMEQYRRPAVLCSFGKDSMVLLHLALRLRLPVVFHREAFMPQKYAFANSVIEAYGLEVYDFPPEFTFLINDNEGQLEVVHTYRNGPKCYAVPVGIDPASEVRIDAGEPFLCGRDQVIPKPKCQGYQMPFDVLLCGHKGSDIDPVHGAVTLKTDFLQQPGGADWAFPLRTWTDADVWEYAATQEVPIDKLRYEPVEKCEGGKVEKWVEKDDKALNSDYFPVCMRCVDRAQGPVVECPKRRGLQMTNIGHLYEHGDFTGQEYFDVDYKEVIQ